MGHASEYMFDEFPIFDVNKRLQLMAMYNAMAPNMPKMVWEKIRNTSPYPTDVNDLMNRFPYRNTGEKLTQVTSTYFARANDIMSEMLWFEQNIKEHWYYTFTLTPEGNTYLPDGKRFCNFYFKSPQDAMKFKLRF